MYGLSIAVVAPKPHHFHPAYRPAIVHDPPVRRAVATLGSDVCCLTDVSAQLGCAG